MTTNGIAFPTAGTEIGLALEETTTTVASGSNSGEISTIASWSSPSAGVLDVASITGLPTSGFVTVAASGNTVAVVQYTGVTTGQLTGCTYISGSPTGTVSTGGLVTGLTRGTAASPSYWFPTKSPKYKPDLTLIPDETLQGSMVQVYQLVRGIRYDSHGWSAPPYLDGFPILLRAELGSNDQVTAAPSNTTLYASAAQGATSVQTNATIASGSYIVIGSAALGTLETHLTGAVTGTTAPFTVTLPLPLVYAQPSGATVTGLTQHKFSLLNNQQIGGNQPPSVTITDYDGEEWRQITAAQLDELNIKGNGTSLVEYTCTWFGNPATTPSTPSPSFTGIQTPAPWSFYLSLGGTYTPTVMDWEVDLKRGVTPIPALTGTQEYFTYFANVLMATGKLSFIEQAGSPQLNAFLNATEQSLDLTIFDQKSGSAMNIHSTEAQYKTGEIDRGSEYVKVPIEFQLLPTTTDALAGGVSPLTITVANSVTTPY